MTDVPSPKYLTHSSCEILKECTLHFLFENRMKLKREQLVADYGLGGRVLHDAIGGSIRRMKRANLETIRNPRDFITEAAMIVLQDVKDSRTQSDTLLCLKNYINYMVMRYEHLLYDLNDLTSFLPICHDKELKAVINGVPFVGILDAVYQDTALRLVDWKSDKLQTDIDLKARIQEYQLRQAIRYAILYGAVNKIPVNDFYIVNLRKKINLPDSRVIITPDMIEEEKQKLPNMWDMACGDVFSKNQGVACKFCDYKMRCKLHPEIIDLKFYNPDLYIPNLYTPK